MPYSFQIYPFNFKPLQQFDIKDTLLRNRDKACECIFYIIKKKWEREGVIVIGEFRIEK